MMHKGSRKKKDSTSKYEELYEQNQLQSSFFANISHEFRTPLTLILAPLEILLKTTPPDCHEHMLYLMMKRNADRLLNLINQLLDLSKLEAGCLKLEPTTVDVIGLLNLLAATFAPLAENRKITFTYQLPDKVWNVLLDVDKLEKIVVNLLSNACKFTPDGGFINFQVKIEEEAIKDEKILIIEVSDNGIGIKKDQMEKIFDRFYQFGNLKAKNRDSTGLGLSLTKELVELHGGTIHAQSKSGQGATFRVELPLQTLNDLPLSPESKAPFAVGPLKADSPSKYYDPIWEDVVFAPMAHLIDGEKPILLIVEDNSELSSFIAFHFNEDYLVFEVQNGELGFQKAVDIIPDVVVTDVMMPVMDGIELCQKLKADERTSHIPVILLSAKASQESKMDGLESGADDYLTKPFSAAELQLRVRNLIDGRKRLRERFSEKNFLHPTEAAITSADDRFLKRVIKIIIDHIDEADFTGEAFEKEVGMSHVQFYRKMKSLTNQAPGEFLRNYRLQQAALLLKGRHGNVSEVAYTVGFSSLAYFTRCFKALYKQTPSEYIASHRSTS